MIILVYWSKLWSHPTPTIQCLIKPNKKIKYRYNMFQSIYYTPTNVAKKEGVTFRIYPNLKKPSKHPLHLRTLLHFGHCTHNLFLAKFNESYLEKKHNLNNISLFIQIQYLNILWRRKSFPLMHFRRIQNFVIIIWIRSKHGCKIVEKRIFR
jgi:hypothetical protein